MGGRSKYTRGPTKFSMEVSKTEAGALAKLWKKIIVETGMVNSLDHMINRYSRRSSTMKAGKIKTKSHITKDINSSAMSWKTFTDLLLNFVGVLKFDISVKLYYRNGDTSLHTMTIIKNDNVEKEKEDEDTRNSKKSNK